MVSVTTACRWVAPRPSHPPCVSVHDNSRTPCESWLTWTYSFQSGISPTDEALDAYQRLSRSKIQYLIFSISKVDGRESIVVTKEGEKGDQEAKWEEFVEQFPESEGRYGVFDIRWEQSDGRKRDSVCFVSWTPDGAPIKQKMIYGSTAESFKGTLQGIKSQITAHDISDLMDGRADVMK